MRRREFIVGAAGAAAWPLATRAQVSAIPAIGYLHFGSPESDPRLTGLRRGLNQSGYVEGRNFVIEYRWAGNQADRLPALPADLVQLQVAVIVVTALLPALAAKAATTAIPIVFSIAGDPVELGVVASLNRPGGNLTGVTSLNVEVAPKQIELIRNVIPTATSIALLVNPASQLQAERATKDVQAAAAKLGLRIHVLHASNERDFDTVFATLEQTRPDALVIAPDTVFLSRREQLGVLAARHAIPAICPYREFTLAGGLMSYGTDITTMFRLVGAYTARILKGERPADLPVQQITKLELVINANSAKALGLTIPETLLATADEVIQ
jgi:putative ABC transport system substrate-binding protein